jgi:hypothetical protein
VSLAPGGRNDFKIHATKSKPDAKIRHNGIKIEQAAEI